MNGTVTRIGAITRKEFRHLFRDPRMLVAALLLPVLQLLLFAYAISFDVSDVPTVVVDRDKSAASREFVDAFAASGLFDVRGAVRDEAGIEEAFRAGDASVGIVVQPGFADARATGTQGQVAVLVNGAEPTSARLASAFASALTSSLGREAAVDYAAARGASGTVAGMPGMLEPHLRTWYNPNRLSSVFLIPGLLAVIVMIVTVQQTATSLVREREQGTAEQMQVSPLRSPELMVGKLLPWTVLALIDAAIIVALGTLVFGVPFRGDPLILVLGTTLFIASSLAIGLIVSAVVPTLELANIISMLIAFLPAFMLSGFAFPLASVPGWLQVISYAFPARYMVSLSRDVFLKGTSWAQSWPELTQLSVYLVVVVALAAIVSSRRAKGDAS